MVKLSELCQEEDPKRLGELMLYFNVQLNVKYISNIKVCIPKCYYYCSLIPNIYII